MIGKIFAGKRRKIRNLLFLLIILLLCLPVLGDDPPSPHNVAGRVFNQNGIDGVPNGIPIIINNTVSHHAILTFTYAPPIPALYGLFSATINGSDLDAITLKAWNSTHYGFNSSVLSPTSAYANIVLNTTRPSENNVTILTPEDNSVKNTSLSFNVTANITIIGGQNGESCNATISFSNPLVINVSAQENLTKNLSSIPLNGYKLATWNVTVIAEGISNISVTSACKDQLINFDNVNFDYVYNITTNDTSPPVISIIYPDNNSLARRNFTVFYNVTDHSGISNCSIYVNGTQRAVNHSIPRKETLNFTVYLNYGNYSYFINCTDNSSNYNSGVSQKRFINITETDLEINSSDIVFSEAAPIENQNITINATAHNTGSQNITQPFIIQFFEGSPIDEGTQIGPDILIPWLNVSANVTVSVNWTAHQGTHSIYVLVDGPPFTKGTITEINESNNEANKTITIPSYNIYYGQIGFDILLDSAGNQTVFMWMNQTTVSGNIFFVDSDSSLQWTNITPLGINISGKNSSFDFSELDRALNLTNHTDSINSTYTLNGFAKKVDSFLIYDTNLSNVPIANSTDTSNFVTGLLWDSSDPNNGEYNGSQDILFVTKVNDNAPGKYGVYDYEIKVPANLRKYLKPNLKNSLTIYTELR
jgi:hypothetical protein